MVDVVSRSKVRARSGKVSSVSHKKGNSEEEDEEEKRGWMSNSNRNDSDR
jgi:hypothetical protein